MPGPASRLSVRVLYLSQYFPPEVGATQTRAHEMARALVAAGHQVTMLTEVPNHPAGVIPPAYRGKLWERRPLDGIDVIRLWVLASPHKGFRERMGFYLSYMVMAIMAGLVVGLRPRRRYDVIYATSPPLFVGLAGAVLSVLLRTRFVFEVRDLWPESAVVLGELRNPRAIRLATRVERFCYRRARRVVVVTEGIAARLRARGMSTRRMVLIPNGANVDEFRPAPEAAAALRESLRLDGRFVAVYAGIHGVAQGLETLVAAARLLRADPDIVLLLIGAGPRKEAIRQAAHDLPNIRLLDEQPRAAMAGYLSLAGCAIVPLRAEPLFAGALPSKLFEGLACGTPVVLSAPTGEASALLAAAGAGIAVPPEDPAALAAAIRRLRDHPAEAARLGAQGRAFVVRHYTRAAQARRLTALLAEISRKRRT